jgi:6-phosphogluconolactonase
MEKTIRMELHIYDSVDGVIKGLADYFVKIVNAAIIKNGECNAVLSGGNSPKKLFGLLASSAYKHQIDWNKIYFFFADERYVPFTHQDNNGLMVKNMLFEPLQIADENVFYINTALPPDKSAKQYEQLILSHFENKPPRFDLIILGVGDNAHTASLFPHTPVLNEKKALVQTVYLEDQQSYRITMTAALINEAHAIAFLVYGESKAEAVFRVIKGDKNTETYPAQLIIPNEGSVQWFLDDKAARRLKDK